MDQKNLSAAIDTAKWLVDERFPQCHAALLAGSVVRGEATFTLDLDIVVFDSGIAAAYRESLRAFGWPIEVFVHNLQSYKQFFESDAMRARPSLPRMVSEGIILKNNEILRGIKVEAETILAKGPEKWTEKEIEIKRYFITDTLDDFIGSTNRAEEIFIANTLAELLHEFVLRTNNRWIGNSKWMIRELNRFDAPFTVRFVHAFDTYYRTCEKSHVIKLADLILEPYGGRLFDGFTVK